MNSEAMMKICYKGRMTTSASLLVIVMAMDLIARAQDTRFVTPGAWEEGMINPQPCLKLHSGWEAMYSGALPAECPENMHDLWLKDIRHWRDERKIRIGYDGERYSISALQWTQSSLYSLLQVP
jgi:hypothetical protein